MTFSEALRRILNMWPYRSNEISNAESENVLRSQSELLSRLDRIGNGSKESTANLRSAINAVRISSEAATRHAPDAMAQMVYEMKSGHRQAVRRH